MTTISDLHINKLLVIYEVLKKRIQQVQSSSLPITGGTLTGDLTFSANANIVLEDSQSNSITFSAPTTITGNYDLIFPPSFGTNGQVLTISNGALAWGSSGVGNPTNALAINYDSNLNPNTNYFRAFTTTYNTGLVEAVAVMAMNGLAYLNASDNAIFNNGMVGGTIVWANGENALIIEYVSSSQMVGYVGMQTLPIPASAYNIYSSGLQTIYSDAIGQSFTCIQNMLVNGIVTFFDSITVPQFDLGGISSATLTFALPPGGLNNSYQLTYPADGPNTGQVLVSDNNGNFSWQTPGGGTPGGSDMQIQFNQSGAFGASQNLAFDYNNNFLELNGGLVLGNSLNALILYANGTTTNYTLTFPQNQGGSFQTMANDGGGGLYWTDLLRFTDTGNTTDNLFLGIGAGLVGYPTNNNVAIGINSLLQLISGQDNVAVGVSSLTSTSSGSDNTALGFNSLHSNITGSNLIGIGSGADVIGGNLSNAIVIGTGATVARSNAMVLGNACFVGINNNYPSYSLDIANVSGQCGIQLAFTSSTITTPQDGYIVLYASSALPYYMDATGTSYPLKGASSSGGAGAVQISNGSGGFSGNANLIYSSSILTVTGTIDTGVVNATNNMYTATIDAITAGGTLYVGAPSGSANAEYININARNGGQISLNGAPVYVNAGITVTGGCSLQGVSGAPVIINGGSAAIYLQGSPFVQIGESSGDKVGFYGSLGITQAGSGTYTPATHAAVGGGNIGVNDTFNGYTIGEIVAILQAINIIG